MAITTTAATTTSTTSTTTTTVPTTTTSSTTTTTLPPMTPLADLEIVVEPFASGFEQPVFVTHRPGDPALYVVDQEGTIWSLLDEVRTLVLDLRSPVRFAGEQGLLGLAFHPDDPSRMFVHYSDTSGDTVLAEHRFPLDATTADPNPVQTVLEVDQPGSNHNGGMLAFGPDGMLYLALGDGGGAGDPLENGQDPTTLLGAILRIDVDADQGYTIPPDNPFADGVDGAPEVWVWGVRNPWRFAFDGTNLWIADVGQNAVEEIDMITEGGVNLGWNTMEGTRCYDGTAEQCADPALIPPVFEYEHDGTRCSVTGGYVYRGTEQEGLYGAYLFGDWCSGEVMAIRVDNGIVVDERAYPLGLRNLTSFGVGPDGELYLTRRTQVYRVLVAS